MKRHVMASLVAISLALVPLKAEVLTRPPRTMSECDGFRCSCVGTPSVSEALANARDVALVEPIARRDTTRVVIPETGQAWPAYIVTLRVHRRWKGAPADTLEVLTMRDDGFCGIQLAIGKRYVVFTGTENGRAIVHSCSRTALASRARQTLRELGPPSRRR